MEQRMITQQEKTAKEMRAEEKVRRAQAELAKIRRDQKKELRKAQDHHKFYDGRNHNKILSRRLRFLGAGIEQDQAQIAGPDAPLFDNCAVRLVDRLIS